MKRFWAAAVCLAAGLSALEQARAGLVPEDATVVMHVDLKALNESPMGKFIRDTLDDNAKRGLASLQGMSGIDLTNDVDSLVIYGKGNLESNGVMVAFGRFDVSRLMSIAGGAKAYQNKAVGERSVLSWSDRGRRTHLCFVDPTVAVLSQDEQQVLQAIERLGGKAQPAAGAGPYGQVLAHKKGRFLAVQANRASDLAGRNPQMQLLKQADALLLEVGQLAETNGLDVTLAVKAAAAEQAQQIHQAAQGVQALMMLQAAQNPDVAGLAQGAKVALDGDIVTVGLKLPQAQLSKMVQVRVEQQRAAQEARRAERQKRREKGAAAAGDGEVGEDDDAPEAPKPARPAF